MKVRDFLKEFEGRDPDAELTGIILPFARDMRVVGVANRAEFAKYLDSPEGKFGDDVPDTIPTGLPIPEPLPELPPGQRWNDTYIILDDTETEVDGI
jgi:hypothetical protein